MKKRLYTAYGSNLNLSQMAMRCPTAKLVGIGTIQDYELQFKGRPQGAFATIAPKEGAMVPVAVWALEPKDEQALDWYEGYPSHYFKQDIRVQMSEVEIQAMVYIMDLKQEFGLPSLQYYQTVREGVRGLRARRHSPRPGDHGERQGVLCQRHPAVLSRIPVYRPGGAAGGRCVR